MQVQRIGYGIRGFYRVAHWGHLWEMTPKDAQERLKILRFWERHGLQATRDAFGVSRRTLYRWKQALRGAGGEVLRAQAQENSSNRPEARGRDQAAAHVLSQPGQGKAPRPACPLVRGKAHDAAVGVHPRQDHRPRARQDALLPPKARCPRPHQAHARPPQAAQAPGGEDRPAGVPGRRYHRAGARRHPAPPPHLHRSSKRLRFCPGHSQQSQPPYPDGTHRRPRPAARKTPRCCSPTTQPSSNRALPKPSKPFESNAVTPTPKPPR